jgi:hypothetical protein
MTCLDHEAVRCDACRSLNTRRIWSDCLRTTPAIFECTNPRCQRSEFRVLRLRGKVYQCGVPGVFSPRNRLHSAVEQAHRERAMEGLPDPLDWAIRNGRLRGAEHV